ncbi:hypothetical protein Drorol1_Dr00012410 [Drosera rotundifolia]
MSFDAVDLRRLLEWDLLEGLRLWLELAVLGVSLSCRAGHCRVQPALIAAARVVRATGGTCLGLKDCEPTVRALLSLVRPVARAFPIVHCWPTVGGRLSELGDVIGVVVVAVRAVVKIGRRLRTRNFKRTTVRLVNSMEAKDIHAGHCRVQPALTTASWVVRATGGTCLDLKDCEPTVRALLSLVRPVARVFPIVHWWPVVGGRLSELGDVIGEVVVAVRAVVKTGRRQRTRNFKRTTVRLVNSMEARDMSNESGRWLMVLAG